MNTFARLEINDVQQVVTTGSCGGRGGRRYIRLCFGMSLTGSVSRPEIKLGWQVGKVELPCGVALVSGKF